MLEVGDPIPPRGNTYIAHVATDLAEHMTDGIFKPVLAPGLSNDSQLRSVRRPVALPYCLLDFSWRAAVERHTRQRSGEKTEPHVLCANQHGEFTLGRHCKQLRGRGAERACSWLQSRPRVNSPC